MEVNKSQSGGSDPARRRTQAEPGLTGANRQRNRRAQLEAPANAGIGRTQPADSRNAPGVDHAREGRGLLGDALQLAFAHEPVQNSPAREARLRALTEAFREGSLNSPERLSRAAERLLLG